MTNVEQVLVVPTRVFHDVGLFQGIETHVERYLPHLLDGRHLSFISRPEAETNPDFKQIIPYVVLKYHDQIFHCRRGQGAGEKRLRALRSIGIGGHINPGDGSDHPYRQGMLREVEEEIYLETTWQERCLGLINDDSTPVGEVHLGIVHVFELVEPKVRRREVDVQEAGFASVAELLQRREEFETWSQFVLEALKQ